MQRIFDSHFHIIDPSFPLVPNEGYLPPPFTVDAYLGEVSDLGIAAGAIVGSAVSGLLIRKWGVITVLGAGYGGLAIAIATVTTNSWHLGLASFVVLGLSLGLTSPGTNMLIAELNPERRAAALNLLEISGGAAEAQFHFRSAVAAMLSLGVDGGTFGVALQAEEVTP